MTEKKTDNKNKNKNKNKNEHEHKNKNENEDEDEDEDEDENEKDNNENKNKNENENERAKSQVFHDTDDNKARIYEKTKTDSKNPFEIITSPIPAERERGWVCLIRIGQDKYNKLIIKVDNIKNKMYELDTKEVSERNRLMKEIEEIEPQLIQQIQRQRQQQKEELQQEKVAMQ